MRFPSVVHQPQNIEELVSLLENRPTPPSFLGGGTLAIPEWNSGLAPEEVIYLPTVKEMGELQETWCGAATTLAQIAGHSVLPAALREAAALIGSPAIRNMGTIGGNVSSGGASCLAVALLVLQPQVERLEGTPLLRQQVKLEHVLAYPGQVIIRLSWEQPQDASSIFLKQSLHPGGGPNLATVAVCWNGPAKPEECAIAVGSTGSIPHRLYEAEEEWANLYADPLRAIRAVEKIATTTVMAEASRFADVAYRQHLAGVLVKRALTKLTGSYYGLRGIVSC